MAGWMAAEICRNAFVNKGFLFVGGFVGMPVDGIYYGD